MVCVCRGVVFPSRLFPQRHTHTTGEQLLSLGRAGVSHNLNTGRLERKWTCRINLQNPLCCSHLQNQLKIQQEKRFSKAPPLGLLGEGLLLSALLHLLPLSPPGSPGTEALWGSQGCPGAELTAGSWGQGDFKGWQGSKADGGSQAVGPLTFPCTGLP